VRAGGHLPTLWTGRLVTAGRGAGRFRASTLLRCQEIEEAPEERCGRRADTPSKATTAAATCATAHSLPAC
jgi:hypothetical protein